MRNYILDYRQVKESQYLHMSVLSLHSGLTSRTKKGKVEAVDTRPSGLERAVSGQKVGVDVQVLRT